MLYLWPEPKFIFDYKFSIKVKSANCGVSGLQIPVTAAEFAITQGVYCGTFMGSDAAATAPNIIPGESI